MYRDFDRYAVNNKRTMIYFDQRKRIIMIIEQLKQQNGFSPSDKELADLILNYGEELSWLTIRDLADLAFTSTASIQRFCRKLGSKGYKDFKIRFLKEISKGNTELTGLDVNRPFHFGAQASVIADHLSKVYEKAIQSTMNMMDYDKINQAADLIRKADRILLYGIGDSGITAQAFMNRLIKLRKHCVFAMENNEYSVHSMLSDSHTLGIFITYRGGVEHQMKCARLLKAAQAQYIVISSDVHTELTENAAVCLTIPSYETQSDNIATFFSQECFSFYLNVLYSVVYARSYLENKELKKSVDQITSSSTL